MSMFDFNFSFYPFLSMSRSSNSSLTFFSFLLFKVSSQHSFDNFFILSLFMQCYDSYALATRSFFRSISVQAYDGMMKLTIYNSFNQSQGSRQTIRDFINCLKEVQLRQSFFQIEEILSNTLTLDLPLHAQNFFHSGCFHVRIF